MLFGFLVFVVFWGYSLLLFPLLCLASFASYWWDKRRARLGGDRIPEATLHMLDAFGGWPGGLLAQRSFRHKTRKTSFQIRFWLTVFFHLASCYIVYRTFSG